MSESIKGKTALVTGAAKRLGRGVALGLADEGVNVIVHYRESAEEAQGLVKELKSRGVEAWAIQGDLGNPDEAEMLITYAFEMADNIDFIVNNASIYPPSKMEDMTYEDVDINMKVNAWSPFVLSREFAHRVDQGKIVNFLDTRIKDYDWLHSAYYFSKHMLSVMTRMMAVNYAPKITVNAVAPGLILPPPGQNEEYLQRLVDTVPMKKHGSVDDVAEAVLFLLKSSFITGQVIFVDGGRHLRGYMDG